MLEEGWQKGLPAGLYPSIDGYFGAWYVVYSLCRRAASRPRTVRGSMFGTTRGIIPVIRVPKLSSCAVGSIRLPSPKLTKSLSAWLLLLKCLCSMWQCFCCEQNCGCWGLAIRALPVCFCRLRRLTPALHGKYSLNKILGQMQSARVTKPAGYASGLQASCERTWESTAEQANKVWLIRIQLRSLFNFGGKLTGDKVGLSAFSFLSWIW